MRARLHDKVLRTLARHARQLGQLIDGEVGQRVAVGDSLLREENVENVDEALLNLEGMDTEIASALAVHGITTRDALADLAGDELVELTGIAPERAQGLIMKARAHWFEAAADSGQTTEAAAAPTQH